MAIVITIPIDMRWLAVIVLVILCACGRSTAQSPPVCDSNSIFIMAPPLKPSDIAFKGMTLQKIYYGGRPDIGIGRATAYYNEVDSFGRQIPKQWVFDMTSKFSSPAELWCSFDSSGIWYRSEVHAKNVPIVKAVFAAMKAEFTRALGAVKEEHLLSEDNIVTTWETKEYTCILVRTGPDLHVLYAKK